MINLRVITPATVEPVTVAEANFHLRLTADATDVSPQDDDPLVARLITAARQMAEQYLNRTISPTTWELRSSCFDLVPEGPVLEILSVKYVDVDGLVQTLPEAAYEEAGTPDQPRIRVAYGQTWPNVRSQDDSVRVQYRAGYVPGTLPVPIVQAMLLTIGHLFENREENVAGTIVSELKLGVQHLLSPYRIGMTL